MDSESSSSSSESSASRHRRKRERKARKEERKERRRKEKKHSHGQIDKHREKKKKKHKREKSEHNAEQARSIITGKKIRRADGAAADAEGEARREALRASMNEGEDEVLLQPCGMAAAGSASASLAQQARADPALMLDLMRASATAQASKKQRLASLKRGGGDDYANAIGREYMEHRGTNSGRRPANESAAFMKPDSGF